MKFLMTYQQRSDLPPTTPEKAAAINEHATKLKKAGIIVMTGGLGRATTGTQIRCEGGKVSVTDGPYAETKELIDGFALVEVASRADAIRLAGEFMQLAGDGTSEILSIHEG